MIEEDIEYLEKYFEKGKTEYRGKALVLIALARQQGKKELFLDIIKRKFKGSVRDFLIWFGGPFKDINIEAVDYIDTQIQNASYMGNVVETGSVASDINKTENKITKGAYKSRASLDNKETVVSQTTPLPQKLDMFGHCPVCCNSWDGGDIFDTFREQSWTKKMTTKQLKDYIKSSYSKPYKWSKLIGVEIREKYDGVSLWECPFCHTRFDRWTGKEVKNE
jgi:hypothetical protein